jgi:HK97 gp10 family phage protein
MAKKSRFARMLDGLEPAIVREVEKHMYAAGQRIQVAAQISITEGAVSGKGHKISAPGAPPNADTHHLANQIETLQVDRLRVIVTSQAKYSAALEYGTSKMAPRPFMVPAARAEKAQVTRILRQSAKRAIRAHFGRSR